MHHVDRDKCVQYLAGRSSKLKDKMKVKTLDECYESQPNLKKEDVKLLQDWMSKQSHLPKIDEIKIIIFLHSCYYKIEQAKTCIENFYTLRAHWPEFSQNRDINSKGLQVSLQAVLLTVLPLRTKQNYVIMYSRLMDRNPDAYDTLNQIKLFDMSVWMWYKYEGPSDGQVLVIDMEGGTFSHLMRVNLVHLKKHMYYVQEALPVRLKAIHMINVSPITDKLVSMMKPLMKKEMMDLMHIHSKIDSVFDHIPKEALPNELGGQAGTFKELHDKQIKLTMDHAQYSIQDEAEIADESRRQGKPKNLNDVFGIEGTFKKLDID
ncbi:hypothetical protein Trydic_g23181 [Trypoxylus dichotomus]